MPDSPYATASHEGVTVDSNSGTSAEIQAALAPAAKTETQDAALVAGEKPADAAPTSDETAADAPSTAEATAAETAKADKRTREGRKATIQAEIDALTTTKHTTAREVEAAKAELARLRAERATLEPPKTEPAKTETTKADAFPDFATWTADHADATYEDYIDARQDARWAAKEAAKAATQTKSQQTQAFQARLQKARKDIPDFDARVSAANPVLSEAMFDVIMESELSADLMLYLCDHLDESQRISTLHPIQAIREMGKVEARVEAAKSGPARTTIETTSAKPPIKPVSGSPITTDKEPTDEDSDDAWLRAEQAKVRAGRRR